MLNDEFSALFPVFRHLDDLSRRESGNCDVARDSDSGRCFPSAFGIGLFDAVIEEREHGEESVFVVVQQTDLEWASLRCGVEQPDLDRISVRGMIDRPNLNPLLQLEIQDA